MSSCWFFFLCVFFFLQAEFISSSLSSAADTVDVNSAQFIVCLAHYFISRCGVA